ncbi:MAG: hypothetical protein IPP71_03895 [Bacteroidetes bacterium]|nr:hypothetical protein [Bacteroidota bacterium]
MKTKKRISILTTNRFVLIATLFISCTSLVAQTNSSPERSSSDFVKGHEKDVYGVSSRFIENVGQYGETYSKFPGMGKILYGYEGLEMPVLLTERGVIHLHRKLKGPTPEEREKEERKKKRREKETDFELQKIVDRAITMEWMNSNPSPEIISEDIQEGYHTYGSLPSHANAYKKITYKELYPGVDLVYNFTERSEIGYEYSLIVRPGANISTIKLRFGGDVRKVRLDEFGNLIVNSSINSVLETIPFSFYGDTPSSKIKIPHL